MDGARYIFIERREIYHEVQFLRFLRYKPGRGADLRSLVGAHSSNYPLLLQIVQQLLGLFLYVHWDRSWLEPVE